ncbi:unnamed protein product [Symbiodinium natans]|uniref:Uncharacterized protein n=1 Tax=Symbiodinium natans TaxID=878477 RepID=A0A812HYU5_9DINO|nr:unnamed protein product [Symbiodinium natans]
MQCAAEAILGMLFCWKYIEFFVLKRRPQAGIVQLALSWLGLVWLTTRRIFQVTKTPRFLGLMGPLGPNIRVVGKMYTEPLIKLDVLVHNCGIFYGQLQMESAEPCLRKVLCALLKMPISRRGQILAQGPVGIFKMWRERGDTYNLMNYISQVCYLTPLATLNPKMGKCLMYNEKVAGEKDPDDPPGSRVCCPHTPPPPMMGNAKSILDRYCKRIKGELNVYGRKLVTRPSRCKDLFCGRGCNCGCECCCCCQLDELLTEFIVTTHRILVEQRAAQRYCRCTAMCRKTPSIRVTFLAHNQAAAYVGLMPVKALTRTKIQQDFTIKLLQQGAREYQQGLMLHQKPYVIAGKKDLPIKHKVWVPHINMIFDMLTQKAPFHEDSSGAEDDSDEEEFYEQMKCRQAPMPPIGVRLKLGEVVVAQSPKLYEMLETLPLTELPKEKIRAAVVRVDERISQEVWRSILQFIYQGTILQEQCTYLHDVARCFELLFAVLLFRLPEPLLRLAMHSLYVLLPVSNPMWAFQVFQLCSQKEHFENQELRPIRDAAAVVLMHAALDPQSSLWRRTAVTYIYAKAYTRGEEKTTANLQGCHATDCMAWLHLR